jgi:hypothetical protein
LLLDNMASPVDHLTQVSTTSCASSIRARPLSQGARPPLTGSSLTTSAVRSSTNQGLRRTTWSEGSQPLPLQGDANEGSSFSRRPRRRPGAPLDEEQQNLAFDRMYNHLMAEETNFVGELERFLDSHEQMKVRKQQQLYTEWDSDIFEHCQDQIARQVNARSIRKISNRHNDLMQRYLDVSNRKTFGVFRDIVIESEYDPMQGLDSTIKYDGRLRHDPMKRELHEQERQLPGLREPPAGFEKRKTGTVPRIPVQMWAHLEETPYVRMAKVVPRPDAKPYELVNRVQVDQYSIPKGKEVLQRELPLGKRCFVEGAASRPPPHLHGDLQG